MPHSRSLAPGNFRAVTGGPPTPEQFDALTQPTPVHLPAGGLLRRYWQPVVAVTELTEEHPIRPVQVLSERLVLFLDKTGRVGLMQDRCTHVSGPMILGHVEEAGIVCGFHGWTFDPDGNCWQPWYNRYLPVPWGKARAYPVQQHNGLYWAYLGPPPTPPWGHRDRLVSDP